MNVSLEGHSSNFSSLYLSPSMLPFLHLSSSSFPTSSLIPLSSSFNDIIDLKFQFFSYLKIASIFIA